MSNKENHELHGVELLDETALRGEMFLEKYLKHILIGVGVVVIGVGGYFAYKKLIAEPAGEKAAVALFKAEDKFLTGQDSLALKGEGVSSKGLDAIIKEYSGSDAANLAQAYKGIALYDAGKYDESIAALKQFSSKDEYVGPSIQRLIGDAYTQLGKYQDAVSAYEAAAKAANNEAISPSCLLKAGHAYEKLRNKAKAAELYQSIKDQYAATPEAQMVDADLARVGK